MDSFSQIKISFFVLKVVQVEGRQVGWNQKWKSGLILLINKNPVKF